MSTEHFHNLIVGSGVAGKLLSWTLAKQGQKTVVIERSMVGGSCPNVAEGLIGLFANPPAAPAGTPQPARG